MAAVTPFLKTISEGIVHSKLGRKLIEEARQMASARRLEAFEELQAVAKDGSAELNRLAAAEAKAQGVAAKAAAAYVETQRELFAATQARSGAAYALDRKKAEHEERVLGLAPPELDAFLRFLQAVLDGLNTIQAPAYPGGRGEGVFELIRAARARTQELRLSGEPDQTILMELRETRKLILKAFRKLGGIPHALEAAADFESHSPEAA